MLPLGERPGKRDPAKLRLGPLEEDLDVAHWTAEKCYAAEFARILPSGTCWEGKGNHGEDSPWRHSFANCSR